jgi:hypothetical protein
MAAASGSVSVRIGSALAGASTMSVSSAMRMAWARRSCLKAPQLAG